jgi:excinuclease ABC subunit A
MPISIRGAWEHNLQHVDAEFGDGLTVVTGVSGSGKTSLVFDTVYHEARRRSLEVYSLGSAALRLAPARLDAATGLGPAVAVGQNLLNRNPLSTLATASGLHPFLRLLYARYGERRCARCEAALEVLSEDDLLERLAAASGRGPLEVRVPLVRGAAGSHRTLLAMLGAQFGRAALCVDGAPWRGQPLAPALPHSLDVTVLRAEGSVDTATARRAVEAAAALGAHALTLATPGQEATLSRAPVCPGCGAWFGSLEPIRFRTPCPHCEGRGCERCAGSGLHPDAAGVRWQGRRFAETLALSVREAAALLAGADLPLSAARLRQEMARRLAALERVGLGYLALNRPSPTLSRGESQRVRLAVALTSRLEDMLHVLDEPTIGLHPADVGRLLPALRDLGGPVIYVEHDRVAAAEADRAIDLGPGAGSEGGRVIYTGSVAGLWAADTPTGRHFSLRQRVAPPPGRPAPRRFLWVRGAHLRNLQSVDLAIPLGRLTVITGVSGSGKSTFVEDVLAASLAAGEPRGCRAIEGPALRGVLVDQGPIGRNPRSNPATYTKLADLLRDLFSRQTGLAGSCFSFNRPEGACPTCQGIGAVEVAMRYLPSTWIPCSACDGQRFRDEVLAARVPFEGRDLSIADVLALSIAQVRDLLAADVRLPEGERSAAGRILDALCDIGLGYLTLGQPSPTLSGGEAQRVKLARYLGRRALGGQMLILDEPSTGLHPQDVAGLLTVLDRLARAGATVVVVEHNADVIRAADWAVDLGPGAGPEGGRVLYQGPVEGLAAADGSLTGRALREEEALAPRQAPAEAGRRSACIAIRGARANNLRGVDVDIPKRALTVVTGVSGSGKSSLVGDVLEAEARRRYLETLSLYERQTTREGPEAPVEGITGLGVAVVAGPERRLHERRATVGTATEITHHLAALLASAGQRRCLECSAEMVRGEAWRCPSCGATAPLARSRHFDARTYSAACPQCHGTGTLLVPQPEKLIIHPARPLCGGAMYSPGFFPKGYLCEPSNGGYDMVQALAARYGFDPARTPWDEMTPASQQAFLFGDPEPLEVHYTGRSGRTHTARHVFRGFYGWVGEWDLGGTYTAFEPCPACGGRRLRPEYLAVTLGGHDVHALSEAPLARLAEVLDGVAGWLPEGHSAAANLATARRRLHFLAQVGLGYLHLNREAASLSAGEAQRIRLAGLLGSGLTSLTILADEPTRGLHPREVGALVAALRSLREEGNTVIVVEPDAEVSRAADHVVDMGPGAGTAGGTVVAQGSPEAVRLADTPTGRWLRGEARLPVAARRRTPRGWLTVRRPRANNLAGQDVRFPLGLLVGLCGVSGSGKSTLLVDTVGRALAPQKHTTSMAQEPLAPGAHDGIDGAPARAIIVDQRRAGVVSPASILALERPLRALYADTVEARALGLDEDALGRRCSACNGSGFSRLEMGFLPDVFTPCEVCGGTGCVPEAWDVRLQGIPLPEIYGRTLDEVWALFGTNPRLARPLAAAREVGLGYLVVRQPGYALSGGEAQRLKIAAELCRPRRPETLYILDEPTLGQHLDDVARLVGVLRRLADGGSTVLVSEHHPRLLAACDWLVELGPGGGPEGGRVIAEGPPEAVATLDTPTAPYLRAALEGAP